MMPDREKVIKGLEMCLADELCDGCPYEENCFDTDIDNPWGTYVMRDALALLKEQEAVAPILIREGRNKNYNDYVCPRCDNEVVYEQNYCSECGVQFLWEGR